MEKQVSEGGIGRCSLGELYDPFSAAATYDIFAQARSEDPETYSAQITLSPATPFTDEVLATLKEGGFASKSEVDLVAEIFYEFPAHILFLILGIPDSDVRKIKQWADNRLFLTFGQLTPAEQLKCAKDMVAYWHYTEALVEQRSTSPGDDYPSQLLKLRDDDDSILTLNEIVSVVFGLLLAGHETTTNASANAFHTLLTHRENWQMICADPGLIPNAVHEALRFKSSVVCWRRKTMKSVEIAGTQIPAGANLLLALGSANRDEDRFDDAHVFDVMRKDANQNISFGYGKHFCVGAPLARLEMEVLLEEMTNRFPEMRLVEDQDIDIIRTIAFRGPTRLLVNLGV